jgi:hypothetical protein
VGHSVVATRETLNEDFDPASSFLLSPHTGRYNPGIVEYQQIFGAQQRRKVSELAML